MAPPVWVLSVDVQTKTASFTSGMGDAAKSARGSFKEIESSAKGMGAGARMGMEQAREGVELLAEQMGVRMPRALTEFMAGLGPMAAAIQMAFPFLAVAALAGILIEQLSKLHASGEALTKSQVEFGTAAQNAFNDLDKKLLEVGITTDDLNNNHADALLKKLKLIDMQSMEDLARNFGVLEKAADAVFKNLDGHWYTFEMGSTGAKDALDQFQTHYADLLAHGKSKEASDLLGGTLNSAKQSLAKLEQAQAVSDGLVAQAHGMEGIAILPGLKMAAAGKQKEVDAQRALVATLEDQVTTQGKIDNITGKTKQNAVHADNNEQSAKRAAAAKEGIATQQAIAAQRLAAEKATADASLTIHHATLEARLALELDFATKERDIQQAANQQDITALDKSGKDYSSQLKALQDNALKITAEYNAKVTELKSKASVAEYNRDIQQMEQAEALKISVQKEGTAARMAVIDSAIAQEKAKGLESTEHYQELLRQRSAEALKEAEIEKKLTEDSLDAQVKASQAAAAEKVKVGSQKISIQQSDSGPDPKQIAMERLQEEQSYQIKQQALQQQLELYKQAGQDRVKQAQEVQAQLDQLEQNHADKIDELSLAREQSNQAIVCGHGLGRQQLSHPDCRGTSKPCRHGAEVRTGRFGTCTSGALCRNDRAEVFADGRRECSGSEGRERRCGRALRWSGFGSGCSRGRVCIHDGI